MPTRVAGSLIVVAFLADPALAQFSALDGYAPDGTPHVQVELTPYIWLPAVSGTARVGGTVGRDFSFDRALVQGGGWVA